MTSDLTDLLTNWPHDPEGATVRVVEAADGRPLLQIRLDLGLLQLELEGRPDGRPLVRRPEPGQPIDDAISTALVAELSQFDTRGRALLLLGDPASAARDADHMVETARVLHASGDSPHAMHLLVHSITLRARAAAEASLATQRPDLARLALDQGLELLVGILGEDAAARCNEGQLLTGMRDLLVPRLPASQRAELESRLRGALASENYELAAILRDELRMMR